MPFEERAVANFDINLRAGMIALALRIVLGVATTAAQAQTLSVLHTFSYGGDGAQPTAGLTIDQAGNLYGTTSIGGAGYGTVFKLSRAGTGWILNILYTFQGGDDGGIPYAAVVFGPDGALYGTTNDETISGRVGTVFRLTPPSHPCRSFSCPWTKSVLYRFLGGTDGAAPGYGNLVFDAQGNIYGTTIDGGGGPNCQYNNCGVVYKLSRSGGSWTESVLHRFDQSLDSGNGGYLPNAGVILDSAGNLYGTTPFGGAYNVGVVFQLTQSGDSWTETVLHSFAGFSDGDNPFGGVVMDRQGNLYGTTVGGPGSNNGGTVYQLQPSGGSWTYSTLTILYGNSGPADAPILDAAGNLYLTSTGGGLGAGNIFKLTPSGGSWTYTDLHDFNQDGSIPYGSVVLDAHGNIYGTTTETSTSPWGEVWELTP